MKSSQIFVALQLYAYIVCTGAAVLHRKQRGRENRGIRLRAERTALKPSNGFVDNYFVGTQAIVGPQWNSYRVAPYTAHEYSEYGWDMLTELRDVVTSTGMNHFKFKLSPDACESYRLTCSSSDLNSLAELSQVPEIAETLGDARIRYYHIWTYSFNMPRKLRENFTDELLSREYEEVFGFVYHLLKRYKDSGKVFFLGNWEGDWELLLSSGCGQQGNIDTVSCVPADGQIEKYIKWAKTRQRAIDDAKALAGEDGVDVFFYIEFNLAEENYQEHPDKPGTPRPTMLNSVVGEINPDFLSYSSYKSTNRYMNHQGQYFNQQGTDEAFWGVLDYASSKLQDKEIDFSSVLGDMTKRVFIGEFSPVRHREEGLHVPSTANIIRAALEWGCPFVLHWQSLDNYSNAVPLIPTDNANIGVFSPLRALFRQYYTEAGNYVSQSQPTQEELRLWSVEWFREKYPEK